MWNSCEISWRLFPIIWEFKKSQMAFCCDSAFTEFISRCYNIYASLWVGSLSDNNSENYLPASIFNAPITTPGYLHCELWKTLIKLMQHLNIFKVDNFKIIADFRKYTGRYSKKRCSFYELLDLFRFVTAFRIIIGAPGYILMWVNNSPKKPNQSNTFVIVLGGKD